MERCHHSLGFFPMENRNGNGGAAAGLANPAGEGWGGMGWMGWDGHSQEKLGSRKTSQRSRVIPCANPRIPADPWKAAGPRFWLIPGSFPASLGWILIKLRILINSWSPKRNQTLGGPRSGGGRGQTPPFPHIPDSSFPAGYTRPGLAYLPSPAVTPKQPQKPSRDPKTAPKKREETPERPPGVTAGSGGASHVDPNGKTPREGGKRGGVRPRGTPGVPPAPAGSGGASPTLRTPPGTPRSSLGSGGDAGTPR